jgi:hypothetical protein
LRGRPIPLEGVHLRRREERIAAVLREKFGSETELGIFYNIFSRGFFASMQCCGSRMFLSIPDLIYRIPNPTTATKEEGGKIFPTFL